MSEQVQAPVQAADVHAPAATALAAPAVPFSDKQIDQFDADDGDAGRAIGKMLALFFLYTVIVMTGVGYWTFGHSASVEAAKSVAVEKAEKAEAAHEAEAH